MTENEVAFHLAFLAALEDEAKLPPMTAGERERYLASVALLRAEVEAARPKRRAA